MEEVAEQTVSTLKAEVGTEDIVGVSYYDEAGVGHVFRSEWAEAKYDPGQVDAIVEELRFEALGHVVHEAHQEESLHATVRVYDELLDVAVPTDGTRGIAFALDADGEFSIRGVIDAVEQAVADGESTASAADE